MNTSILRVPDMLDMIEEKFSPHPALKMKKDDGLYRTITYKDFVNSVNKVGAMLIKQGVQKTDKIALLCENRPEWPIVYFGTTSIGAVIVPLDPKLEPEEIKNLVNRSKLHPK